MKLHVETRGKGPDVVLLHGWGMHGGVWDELASELAAHFRVHVVDLPGHGASPACNPYTLQTLAGQVARSAPPRCAVCGWSLGGQVALAWARRDPAQVERLALVATTPCFVRRADWPHAVERTVLEQFSQELARDCAPALSRFLALQALGDSKAQQVASRLRSRLSARARPDPETLLAGLRILLEEDMRGELAAVAQPALIVHGECDALTTLAAGEYLSRHLPHGRLAIVRGAAHAPFISDPPRVSALLADFFDGG
jgi:pimeloyl-[acyl-carrier protein] methyl ester esterase